MVKASRQRQQSRLRVILLFHFEAWVGRACTPTSAKPTAPSSLSIGMVFNSTLVGGKFDLFRSRAYMYTSVVLPGCTVAAWPPSLLPPLPHQWTRQSSPPADGPQTEKYMTIFCAKKY